MVTVVAAIVAVTAAVKNAAAVVTNASHAGKAKEKRERGEKGNRVKGHIRSPISLLPSSPFHFLAAGVILSVIRSPARISSTSYSCPAFISPRA